MQRKPTSVMFWAFAVAVIAALTHVYVHQCGDLRSLRNKVVVITGASSGIGEELAVKYGSYGARVVIAARRDSELQRVAARVKAAGAAGVLTVVADMSRGSDCEKVVESAQKFGGGRIDTLVVNHAAFDEGMFQTWNSSADVEGGLTHLLNTNVVGTAHTVRAALPSLIRARGHVGIVSSASAKVGAPFHPGYVASKAALHGFVDVIRHEFHLTETPVTVGILVIGMIATPEVVKDDALKGLAMPVDACAAEMLCALQARWYESYVPKWYAPWTLVTWVGGRGFAEWTMNSAYVLKVQRFVDAIRVTRAHVAGIMAAGERSGQQKV